MYKKIFILILTLLSSSIFATTLPEPIKIKINNSHIYIGMNKSELLTLCGKESLEVNKNNDWNYQIFYQTDDYDLLNIAYNNYFVIYQIQTIKNCSFDKYKESLIKYKKLYNNPNDEKKLNIQGNIFNSAMWFLNNKKYEFTIAYNPIRGVFISTYSNVKMFNEFYSWIEKNK